MTIQKHPFYIEALEDMTVAAVKAQAKLWADTFRNQMPWNNGDLMQNAFHSALTKGVRDELKPEDIDAFEAKLVELTLSPTPIDKWEEERQSHCFDGSLGHGRSEIFVDYHASGTLAAAIAALGGDKPGPNVGNKLNLLVPCKSNSKIYATGITAAFGYGEPTKGVWSTTREVDASEYTVINRLGTKNGRAGDAWLNPIEDGVGELVWVQLKTDAVEPVVQMHKILGYAKTSYWYEPNHEFYEVRRNDGHLAYACSQVLDNGYLALAVRK